MTKQKTRTVDTDKNYLKMGRSMIRRYTEATGEEWSINPLGFARWFCNHHAHWSPSYWRLMRAAMVLTLNQLNAPIEAVAMFHDEAALPKRVQKKPSKNGRSVYRVPKKIEADVIEQYINLLRESRGPMSHLLGAFLYVNQEIGLRPKEWGDAWLSIIMGSDGESLPILIVKNAKNTNGRSTGETRTLIMNDLVSKMVNPSFILRDKAIAQYGDWATVQRKMTLALGDFRRRHKLPPLNLYSTRHQFSANAKSAGLTKRQIADLMGHESDKTAEAHYGKKRYGRGYINVQSLSNNNPMTYQTITVNQDRLS